MLLYIEKIFVCHHLTENVREEHLLIFDSFLVLFLLLDYRIFARVYQFADTSIQLVNGR